MLFCETRHHTQAHITSGALVHYTLSLAARRTQTAERWVGFVGRCLLWRLLLSLPAVVPLLLLPQNNLLTSPAFTPDSESVSATRISLIASYSSFIYFFRPLLETHGRQPCLDYFIYDVAQFQKCNTNEYEHLLQWQQNRSKATMCLLYKNSSYSRVSKTLLVDWQLYVACYYPTTPTDYPSTTRSMSVGPPVAVNIEFCGYLRFLSISFVWIIWVQYATDNLSGQQLEFTS